MTRKKGSAADLFDRLKRKCPAYLDLISAETEQEFEQAFTVILEEGISHLEKNKRQFVALSECGLSAVIAASLTMPGLRVTTEANSNGHVDLTIEADHCVPKRVKLAEAKIYAGPAYHVKGIGQLLGRYTTGRETAGLLLNYVRQPDIKEVTRKLRADLNERKPVRQIGQCQDHTLKWSFTTKHRHDSGEELSLAHVACNLHFAGEERDEPS